MNHGHIFLHHGAFLDGFGQGCGGLLCPGVYHHTAHILIQSVNGENFAAQLLFQSIRYLGFGIQSHGLDTDGDIFIRIQNFHRNVLKKVL